MACWICGTPGGDPFVGVYEDYGICPVCTEAGYTEECVYGCYTDPQGELHECRRHEGNAAERAHEQYLEIMYGSSAPVTVQEQYDAAAAEKRRLR